MAILSWSCNFKQNYKNGAISKFIVKIGGYIPMFVEEEWCMSIYKRLNSGVFCRLTCITSLFPSKPSRPEPWVPLLPFFLPSTHRFCLLYASWFRNKRNIDCICLHNAEQIDLWFPQLCRSRHSPGSWHISYPVWLICRNVHILVCPRNVLQEWILTMCKRCLCGIWY